MSVQKIVSLLGNRLNREVIYSRPEYWDMRAIAGKGRSTSMWENEHLNVLYEAEIIARIQAALPSLKGKEVIDIGCGTGRLSRYLAEQGARVRGIDFSSASISIAKSLSSSHNPTYEVRSVFDLESSKQFDFALTWGTLAIACSDIADLKKALLKIRTVMKDGAPVLLAEPIHKGPLHRVLNISPVEFVDAMNNSGFEVISTQELHFWPMRAVLANIQWGKAFTEWGYRIGQWSMKRLIKGGGDYKAILARAASA